MMSVVMVMMVVMAAATLFMGVSMLMVVMVMVMTTAAFSVGVVMLMLMVSMVMATFTFFMVMVVFMMTAANRANFLFQQLFLQRAVVFHGVQNLCTGKLLDWSSDNRCSLIQRTNHFYGCLYLVICSF